jgi:hypothetical protein
MPFRMAMDEGVGTCRYSNTGVKHVVRWWSSSKRAIEERGMCARIAKALI